MSFTIFLIMSFIHNNIRFLRKKNGYGQEHLAAALSISQSAVSAYEMGKSQPTPDGLIILANLFGITIDNLIRKDLSTEESIAPIQAEITHIEALQQEIADLREAVKALAATQQKFIEAIESKMQR